jgi:redox-sensitive bicupin YhaK (pirin superfamily)
MSRNTVLHRPEPHQDGLGKPVQAKPLTLGKGFNARHFSEEMFDGQMDPLLMVDHFVMTEPTFEPHLHAGISAVTVMFDDAVGDFLNRDTLGHNIAIKPGDVYWLAAGRGAAHEERPAKGARAHGLQIFVNLPARLKREPARSLHIRAKDVPVLTGNGKRVRVLLGRSADAVGAEGTPEPITVLDGVLEPGGRFLHTLPPGWRAWVYATAGSLTVRRDVASATLEEGFALTVASGEVGEIALEAEAGAHFALLAAKPIRETFVKRGPLVMSSEADVRQTLADYAGGRFGRIPA